MLCDSIRPTSKVHMLRSLLELTVAAVSALVRLLLSSVARVRSVSYSIHRHAQEEVKLMRRAHGTLQQLKASDCDPLIARTRSDRNDICCKAAGASIYEVVPYHE